MGPELWNLFYDNLLRQNSPDGVEFIAFVNDLAVLGIKDVYYQSEEILQASVGMVVNWMNKIRLELPAGKTEVIT